MHDGLHKDHVLVLSQEQDEALVISYECINGVLIGTHALIEVTEVPQVYGRLNAISDRH